ncbi:DNA-binding transcriptional regulator, AcrR family [Micromonospora pallida]|uniref:DNA-binding transcriptional regulator, AcrR family n=1 Tax=Micromonospora pallida TaxID=145854 RepID=A0A1C6RSF5_9ACTN|nr:TetR/AcrR family transcriptional regulator [Micromonospora pallida]SCL20088.1 DNA-binding transcriptional regulator, AcrR family [Micromonospora pallida]
MSTQAGDGVPGRREEIFGVAAEIFWTKGYHATSMNDVADAMGMRKPSLYHHVKNKETLLYEMSVSSMHHIIDAALSAANPDPETHLREIIIRHVEALLMDRSRHATALVELRSLSPEQRQHVTSMRRSYDKLIDEAIGAVQTESGRWSGMPTHTVRLALLGMLNWTVFWFRPEGPETPEHIAREFCRIFMPGGSERSSP